MNEVYGDYEVESFLGKGSIGKVYLARHRRIGRRVALKTVHLEQRFEDDDDRDEFFKRLQREAELCAAMQHPNVVTLYDVGYQDDIVSYLATEYVDGESLLARLRRTRPLPLDEALSITTDVLRGLAYAHSKGIIHRDIKPANILLTAEGQAKIADFGVARPLHSSLTSTRTLVGTPNYMSPEQVKTTPVSPRSDLFSAGVVMYEMLTGVKPFAAPELSGILYNVVNLVPGLASDVNPAVPPRIARVVARLLSKSPETRFGSAAEALAELEAARAGRNSIATEAETIAILRDDATTPFPMTLEEEETEVPLIRREVPALAFWLIVATLIFGLGASVMWMQRSVQRHAQSTVVMPQAELDALEAKRRALDDTRTLVQNGKYEEAIQSYDAYLARYPQSVVAAEERAEAQRLFEESKPKAQVTVAKKPPPEQTTTQATQTEEKKPSRWQRFKKWFKGN